MEITFDDFQKVDIRTGTIREAERNPKARAPAYILAIDFGPLGIKTSSAQLTGHYTEEDLIGKQIAAVVNFPAKRVAGVSSEVLVLAAVDDRGETILLEPTFPVANGLRVA